MFQRPLDRGDVLLSLSYLPTAERLILVVVKARNLTWPTTKPIGGKQVTVCDAGGQWRNRLTGGPWTNYIKGPIPHFEFTEQFIIIKVLITEITIKHKTMMKCEVDVHKKLAVE